MKKKMIFTLGTIIFILFLTGQYSFGQGLVVSDIDREYYSPSDLSSLISGDKALLLYTFEPSGPPASATLVTQADIVNGRYNVDWSFYTSYGSIGRYRYYPAEDLTYVVAVIDPEYYYGLTSPALGQVLPLINNKLSSLGLGTVSQRKAYINNLNSSLLLSPVDFRNMLSGWIWAGIIIFLSVPFWFIIRRFLKR